MGEPIHLERETWDKAAQVADDFWIIATHHRPGFARISPDINNRCLVFRLKDAGKDVLLVANGVDAKAMPEVRRLEKETGSPVKYLLSVGGGHHLYLPAWRDEFTEAAVLVGPVRVPSTPGARKLMEGPRVKVMDMENPLPQFAGQLDAVLFHGLYGVRDHKTPFEGGKEPSMFTMMKMMMSIDDPIDELWLHHAATDTVIGGENLGWILSEKTIRTFPFMMRMMMKANAVYVQTQARKVADAAKVEACWKRVTAWSCKTLIGYHEPPGDAFVGDGREALLTAARAVRQLS